MIPVFSIVLFALAGSIAYLFMSGFIWGAGYYPTSKKEIDSTIRLLNLKEDSTFFDLGSGFGRMIISIAEKCKVNCVGVEIDPLKCAWSRLMIRRKGLSARVKVIRGDLLTANIGEADGIFVFLSNETKIMKKLKDKVEREARPQIKIVSYIHRFRNWVPEEIEGSLYLYSVKRLDAEEQRENFNLDNLQVFYQNAKRTQETNLLGGGEHLSSPKDGQVMLSISEWEPNYGFSVG